MFSVADTALNAASTVSRDDALPKQRHSKERNRCSEVVGRIYRCVTHYNVRELVRERLSYIEYI